MYSSSITSGGLWSRRGGGSVLFIVRGPFLQSCVLLWSRGSRVLCIALFESVAGHWPPTLCKSHDALVQADVGCTGPDLPLYRTI